jgi:UDP-N-acetylglucosamine--N-acetylmuramyl-(pentapeptide) pyrophosphoryl-undecaprenol N-acetylglucosamine transferase
MMDGESREGKEGAGPKLLIAGGGTGGHVFPAIEIAREWLRRDATRKVVLVGTARGMETKLAPAAGLPLELIRAAGLKGTEGMKLLKNLTMLVPALADSIGIVRRHHFQAAVAVGGYAAGPITMVAALAGVPALVFEPNSEAGFTNRLLARVAKRIAVAFEETAERWPSKAHMTGGPVRPEFFAAATHEQSNVFRVLITGGSQGSLPINRTVADSLDLWKTRKNQLFIVHQTGERDYNAIRVAYARREFNAEVSPFIGNMAEQFALADVIVCRSGAITVAEIAAAGRAAILIPFGAATDSHQLRNAEAMERRGAAAVIPQDQLTPQTLTEKLFSLLDDPARTRSMQTQARALARPNATQDIVDLVEGMVSRA